MASPSARPTYPPLVSAASALRVGSDAERLVAAAVHQLEQLDRELDVAQPTHPELELPVGLAGRDGLDDPAPHGLHVADEPVASGDAPDEGGDQLDELLAELQVAGHRPCLEQRLELPRLGPALVVAAHPGHGADQRAGLALGPQGRVDRPDGALGGVLRARPHQLGRELGGGPGGDRLRSAFHRLVHEDHVDVGDVVELVPAALAHRDHGQADGGGVLPHLRPGDREAGVERAGREVGQLGGHVVDADVVGEVASRQPDQHPAVLDAHRVEGLALRQGGDRDVGERVGADGGEQAGADGVRRRPGAAERGVGELAPLLGVTHQVVGERLAGAEHAQQPHGRALVVGDAVQQLERVVDGLDEPQQAGQGEVRVGGAPEQGDQRLGVVAQLRHARQGAVGVDEPVPQQVAATGRGPGHVSGAGR